MSKEKEKYILIEGWHAYNLVNAVNKKIAEGYQLVGQPFIKGDYFYQAMILRDN